MTRDYSQFLPGASPEPKTEISTMTALGWQPFFAQQIGIEALDQTPPARVTAVHRSGLSVTGDGFETQLPPSIPATVGDWVLVNHESPAQSDVLRRKSLIKRRAPGHDRAEQLIAANVDTAFITSSCNADFNIARLERYIALALEAEIVPVIVLTKADMNDPTPYVEEAKTISELAQVIALNAKSDEAGDILAPWCKPGQTVAFMGSSGVGKSTLVNALLQGGTIATQAIREDDARGRHTTTHRELHIVPGGCAVLDTPGMRELQLTDAASGVAELFDDIVALAAGCKFNDCAHDTEPGCAVKAALEAGELDEARLNRWRKLQAEDAFNSASLSERRAKEKAFGKMVKGIMKDHQK